MAASTSIKDLLDLTLIRFFEVYGAVGRVLEKQRRAREEQ